MTHSSLKAGLLALALAACGGTSGTTATDTSTTVDTTTSGMSSTTVEPTGTTVEPTGTTLAPTGTTVDSDAGSESDSASSSSTGTDPSTSTTTLDTSTSTGDTTDDTSTGDTGGVVPGMFSECEINQCPASDPLCVIQEGPGGFDPNGHFQVKWSFCTRECDSDEDCASGLAGGTAPVRCVPSGPNMVNVCVLDCGFGLTCPDSLVCSDWENCGTKSCECEGPLCDDPLCAGP